VFALYVEESHRLTSFIAASQMAQQMSQMNPGAMMQPNADPDKMFKAEAENLEVIEHKYLLDGIEERVLVAWAT
jgi:hypothetical protein